jgi:hypothetical protein
MRKSSEWLSSGANYYHLSDDSLKSLITTLTTGNVIARSAPNLIPAIDKTTLTTVFYFFGSVVFEL